MIPHSRWARSHKLNHLRSSSMTQISSHTPQRDSLSVSHLKALRGASWLERLGWILLIIGGGLIYLGAPSAVWARTTFPFQLSTPGDQSVVRLKVSNIGSAPRLFKFGPAQGQRATQEIDAYESREYFFQCLKRNDLQETPELLFTLGREEYNFDS